MSFLDNIDRTLSKEIDPAAMKVIKQKAQMAIKQATALGLGTRIRTFENESWTHPNRMEVLLITPKGDKVIGAWEAELKDGKIEVSNSKSADFLTDFEGSTSEF